MIGNFLNLKAGRLVILTFIALVRLSPAGLSAQSHVVARIEIDSGPYERHNTPVSIEMDQFAPGLEQFSWDIVELTPEGRVTRDTQMESGPEHRLWWILDGITPANSVRSFELVKSTGKKEAAAPEAGYTDDGQLLQLNCDGRPVIAYQYGVHPAPEGASELYARSAFIHPVYSPAGAILTRINPPDHLHHLGLWNPWTKTKFEGREIDFWNLNKGEGTVRFKDFVSTVKGNVYTGFQALQDHVVLSDPGKEKTALRELLEVRVWNTGDNAWQIDYFSTLNCATASEFLIEKYRYQGFGFRAAGAWDDENCRLLTSEGKDKSTANATRARWCIVEGPTSPGASGILFMSSPANYDFPELLRIWPVGANKGKENVFFNFNPAQDRDWLLLPGQTYTLHYRMYVYDGSLPGDTAEKLWNDFAHPPVVAVEKLNR